MRRSSIIAAAVFGALLITAGAFASGGAILKGYGGQAGKISHQVSAPSSGTLPFTGLDLALVVGGAMLLVLAGLVIRRSGRGRA